MSENNVMHLLRLASRGKPGGGGSGAEKQARKIVACLLDNAVGLDSSATTGIADLIAMVQASPQEARETFGKVIR